MEGIDQDTIESVTFYYPSSCRHADGNIYMGTSSYTRDSHSSGAAIIVPDHPDYELWLWIMPRLSSIKHGRVSDKDRESFRLEFEQERQQRGAAELFREQLLAAVPVCPELIARQKFEDAIASILDSALIVSVLLFALGFKACAAPFRWYDRKMRRGKKQKDRGS